MAGRQCLICKCFVASALPVGGDAICADIQCRRLHDQRLTMAPKLYAPYLAFQKSLIRERREKESAHKEKVERISREEYEETNSALAAFKADSGREDVVELISLPSAPTVAVPVGEVRRQKYILHLQREMADAVGCEDVTHLTQDQHYTLIDRRMKQDAFLAEHPDIARRSDVLCGICRGGCCMEGGDYAYVSSVMLRRQLDADPELTSDELLARYIGCIPDLAIEGGCINQGETGCGLPRGMRSDVCNHFLCEPVREHQARMKQLDAVPDAFVVQRSNHHWNRFASDSANTLIACYLIEGEDCNEVAGVKAGVMEG